jgi:dipeptidyl aminopeptidase/acylaminoacyl peptidase
MLGTAAAYGLSLAKITDIFAELNAIPPDTWRDSGDLSEQARQVAQGLPLYWLDGSEPPFLLIHGQEDGFVPATESEAFAARLQAAGVEVDLQLWPGAGHNTPLLPICEALEGFALGLSGE